MGPRDGAGKVSLHCLSIKAIPIHDVHESLGGGATAPVLSSDKPFSGYLKMDTAIINLPAAIDQPQLPSTLRAALETAADLGSNSRAASTRAAYASDWRLFERWCSEQGLKALPANPAMVAAFLADQVEQGMKPSTLGRRLAAIKHRHQTAGEDSPTDDERVKAVIRGARRTLGVAPRKLAAATSEKTIGMATLVRPGLAELRDRANLLLAFSLAARRSELVALDVEDIEECPEGLGRLMPSATMPARTCFRGDNGEPRHR
jgi:integrase